MDTAKENRELLKKLISLFKPYIKQIILIIICMILSAGITTLIPLLSRQIVDNGLLKNDFYLLTKLVLFSFLLVLTDQGIGMLETRFRVYISSMMPYELSKKAFKHILKLNIKYFNSTNFAEIMNNINMDVSNISRISDRSLFFIVTQIFKVLGGIIGLFIIDWRLAIVVLCTIPIKYQLVNVLAKKRRDVFNQYMLINSEFSSWYGDTISGVKEIKLLGIDRIKTGEFIKKQRQIIKIDIKMNVMDKLNELSETMLFELTTGVLYILGAYLIFNKGFTVGGLMAFITYCVYVTSPISAVLNIGYNFSSILPSAQRFFEFIGMEHEDNGVQTKSRRISAESISGNVKFENISFSYDEGHKVLNNISFEIQAGERVAIIGINGSGKTTLLNLFLRFFSPSEGKILIDGIDISTICLRDYRQLISIVSQDIYLFDTSISDNILPLSKGKELRVQWAAKDSNIHDFIESLPQKYDTRAGSNGSNFSGGQRQKIAMARAIAKDSKFLVLDEATSNYDIESENHMIGLIKNKLKDKTVIMISHKPQVLEMVDKIVLIEDGNIKDIGNHSDLYSRCKEYREIINNVPCIA